MTIQRCCFLFLVTFLLGSSTQAQEYVGADEPALDIAEFGKGVRDTDWRSPEEEKASFRLPPGFVIELVASEPAIAKPLNMAWDRKGRLWVSSTVEYPYPAAPESTPRDSIKVLEDTDGDGVLDQTTTFADELNIPMGLLPVEDGVICFSIPYLWHLRDEDGDGRVDERIKLLGPFDTTRDTHGMINALRRGADGWIYACHGFNNQSQVTAKDQSRVHLISGNTFRFKEDGSRIEQYTHGQVNPFGMTQDEFGNWITADCHSKPLTSLISGACYPSFGRPHDGLGFAPALMGHLHGSTAICGVAYYRGNHFPAAYQRLLYSGNVMTSRINCNRLSWQGSTPQAIEQSDFLTSSDPWFRPVDIQQGPDGGLYVADFYNKIIGHYEVPLQHPGRDRDSGRIWRISYQGDRTHEALRSLDVTGDLKTRDARSLATQFSSEANPTRQRASVETMIAEPDRDLAQFPIVTRLEVLGRRNGVTLQDVESIDLADLSSTDLTKLFSLAESWPTSLQGVFLEPARQMVATINTDVHIRRSATQYLGHFGNASDVHGLVALVNDYQGTDPTLAHTAKIAARNLLRDTEVLEQVMTEADLGSDSERVSVLDILPGVGTTAATDALLRSTLSSPRVSARTATVVFELVKKDIQPEMLPDALMLIDKVAPNDGEARSTLFVALCDSYRRKHGDVPKALRTYAERLVENVLVPLISNSSRRWKSVWIDQQGDTWAPQERRASDGSQELLHSSFTRGEKYVGVLVSEWFDCPAQLKLWLAGHNGNPSESDAKLNWIRLVSRTTGEVLASAFPPRNDVARDVQWDLRRTQGESVRVEIVDRHRGGAYAWIAAGGFSHDWLNPQQGRDPFESLVKLMGTGAISMESAERHVSQLNLDDIRRAKLLMEFAGGQRRPLVETLAREALLLSRADLLSFELIDSEPNLEVEFNVAKELSASCTTERQRGLAGALLSSADGCRLVAKLLDAGSVSHAALRGIDTELPSSLSNDVSRQLKAAITSNRVAVGTDVDLQKRLNELDWKQADLALGRQLAKQHCFACHQLRGEGTVIGPQLDGAIVRGVGRLLEDVLDPNRNVDKAFRRSTVLLEGERIEAGLVQDQLDGRIVLVKQDGTKQSYAAREVISRKLSNKSLMPDNFGSLLDDKQLASLISYLMQGDSKP